MRPKTKIEQAIDKEISWDDVKIKGALYVAPHCDARILHHPDECDVCSWNDFKHLHEERAQLDINYTGHKTRKWSCPAERARSSESLNGWYGNVARKK